MAGNYIWQFWWSSIATAKLQSAKISCIHNIMVPQYSAFFSMGVNQNSIVGVVSIQFIGGYRLALVIMIVFWFRTKKKFWMFHLQLSSFPSLLLTGTVANSMYMLLMRFNNIYGKIVVKAYSPVVQSTVYTLPVTTIRFQSTGQWWQCSCHI